MFLWANRIWFGDKSETKFDWSHRVLWGSNEIVSLKTDLVEYTDPKSLFGKNFGGVLEHNYLGIDDYVKKGKIDRVDTKYFSINFAKLIKKRVDAILIPTGELYNLMN